MVARGSKSGSKKTAPQGRNNRKGVKGRRRPTAPPPAAAPIGQGSGSNRGPLEKEPELERAEAEAVAKSLLVPPFKYGSVWLRRGRRYVLLCSKLLPPHVDRYVTRAGKVKMAQVRSGVPEMIKVLGDYGEIFETCAATFFNDPRWPARPGGLEAHKAALTQIRN
jgi:hypothetical protein